MVKLRKMNIMKLSVNYKLKYNPIIYEYSNNSSKS